MNHKEYWQECVAEATEECGLELTPEQLDCIAEHVQGAHENYGMAFYSPPASERLDDIEREWKAKYATLQREFNAYCDNAEKAIKRALGQSKDVAVSIGAHGEVYRHDGRTEQLL